MKNEQASLKEIILESSRVDVWINKSISLDGLIYNHCLNKKLFRTSLVNQETLSVEFVLNYMKKVMVNLSPESESPVYTLGMFKK